MYPVSEEYRKAIQENSRSFYYQGSIVTKTGEVYPFENKDIVKGSGYITNQCCGDGEVSLGNVYAAELGITLFSNIDRYTLQGAEVRISFFLEIKDGIYEEVPLGIFEISEANRMSNCLSLKAYDYMLRFDKPFKNMISNGTAYELLNYACDECGVVLAHTEKEMELWKNGDEILGIYSENDIDTWRDLIFYIAQVLGCFATINRLGELELRRFDIVSSIDIASTQRFSSSFSDFVTRYTAISSMNVKTAEKEYYALEVDDGLTMDLDINPLLQFGLKATREKLLKNILEMITNIRYVPFDSSTIGNPAFDLGDIITFSGGHADSGQITCITKYNYQINGKHTIKCVGKNPRVAAAKSKNEKNITGLINSVEAGKIVVHTFMNASAYFIGEQNTEIANLEFTSNEETDAQFYASILINVKANSEEKSGTATGKFIIPPKDETTEPAEPVEEEKVFSLKWEDDGKAIVTVTYIINDHELTSYYPIETLQSGRHILNLYYPLNGLEAHVYNTLCVWMKISNGTATVDRGQCVATISGQGLSASGNWNGRLELSDSYENLIALTSMQTVSFSGHLHDIVEQIKDNHPLSDSVGIVSLNHDVMVPFFDSIEINPVIVTETIEPLDKEEMSMNEYYVKVEDKFELQLEYQFVSKEHPIDVGRETRLLIDTGQFKRIDSLEVK